MQVTRACIKAWMSSNFSQMNTETTELTAITLSVEFSLAIDLSLFKLAGNEDMNNILDEFGSWPDQTTD